MVSGPIERPIDQSDQDRLDRGRFIERLRDTLINKRIGRSTGVVMGIVGPWGSGKSSILNLLEAEVRRSYPGAVVVSFNPWLISGRNDLVTEFLAELLAALKSEPQAAKAFRKVIAGLTRYGTMLSPAANLLLPNAGTASKAGFEALAAVFERDGSLQHLRKEILKELKDASLPIVVLIDEIDRIEDSEIRAIAQLVRSVMDFTGISYVLSYDADRVIQALGAGGDPSKQAERGRAYLEKIVQLQIPLPLTFSAELRSLLIEELQSLAEDFPFLEDISGNDRFESMFAAIQKGAVHTPRDVKRLVGAFHALAGMVAEDIDWIDVLGFCALICRHTRIVDHIRRTPDMFVNDSLSIEENSRRRPRAGGDARTDLDLVAPIDSEQASARDILDQLFPRLAGRQQRATHANALSSRRALLTILRLGALPHSEARPDLGAAFSEDSAIVRDMLADVARKGELAPYLELLLAYQTMPAGQRFRSFWMGASAMLRRAGADERRSARQVGSFAEALATFLFRAVERDNALRFEARAAIDAVAQSGDIALMVCWLDAHRAIHGLSKAQAAPPVAWVLDRGQTIDLNRKAIQRWKAEHTEGQLLARLWDLSAIGQMIDGEHWDAACQAALFNQLVDAGALGNFLTLAFGPLQKLDKEQMLSLLDWTAFAGRRAALERLSNELSADGRHLLQVALDYAEQVGPRFGPRGLNTAQLLERRPQPRQGSASS